LSLLRKEEKVALYGYARVSTGDRDLLLQLDSLKRKAVMRKISLPIKFLDQHRSALALMHAHFN